MAKDKAQARKNFVKARLQATGKEATPEQRAKFRERFNTLSQTKEGRTRIAQVVLPSGGAEQRKTLKESLRPIKTSTTSTGSTTTAGSSTTSKVLNPGYVPGYVGVKSKVAVPGSSTSTTISKTPGTIAGGTVPAGSSATSAVVPSAAKTPVNVYGDTFEEKAALKLEEWGVPIFGRVAGIGRAYDEGKNSEAGQKLLAASLEALVTGASFGTAQIAGKALTNKFPTVGPTNQTSLRLDYRGVQKDLKKLSNQKFGQTPGDLMGHTTPGGIRAESSVQALQGKLGGPTDYPVRSVPRAYPGESKWATDQASGATGPAFYERNNPVYGPALPTTPAKTPAPTKASKTPTATTVPLTPAEIQARLDAVAKTSAEKKAAADLKARNLNIATKAKNDAAAEAARAKAGKPTTATTVPKLTTPTTVVAGRSGSVYDGLGNRTSGSYKDPVLGDPKPTQPSMPRGLSKGDKDLWKQSDAMLDYENALYAWQKFNKKP